jgi:hypothetical protein
MSFELGLALIEVSAFMLALLVTAPIGYLADLILRKFGK